MLNEPIEERYENAFKNVAAVNPVFPYAAKQQMGKMVEAIAISNKNINSILTTDQNTAIKGGFIAEEFHAETFNLDAILGDNNSIAMTDRYDKWSNHEWDNHLLKKNDNTDIIISKDGKVIQTSQSKYYKNAHDTAGAMSEVVDGDVKYGKNDNYVGPSDQIDDIKNQSLNNIEKNYDRNGDPVRREAYRQTHDKVTDRITDGKSSSTPLSKADADKMGGGDTEHLKKIENQYQTKSTIQKMGQAAVGAAAMSAVVSGSINTVRYIQLAREGKISVQDATIKIVAETVSSAADSAVKASANAGVQSLMVRHGSEKVLVQTLSKQGMKAMLRTNVATVGVVCAIDAVKDLVKLGVGTITKEEFYERQGKGMLNTTAGTAGAVFGGVAAETAAVGLGFTSAGSVSILVPMLGGLSGGLIAGMAMQLAIENGVEKPYQDLVKNTTTLHEAALALEQASQTVFMGQVIFTKYLEADMHMEAQLQEQFSGIDRAGQNALDAINKI
jgi:hypothetical protein